MSPAVTPGQYSDILWAVSAGSGGRCVGGGSVIADTQREIIAGGGGAVWGGLGK